MPRWTLYRAMLVTIVTSAGAMWSSGRTQSTQPVAISVAANRPVCR